MAAPDVPPIRISDEFTVWAASDLHGQLGAVDRLLGTAGLTDGGDRWTAPAGTAFVVTGDVVDRGPDTVRLVRRLASLRAHPRLNTGAHARSASVLLVRCDWDTAWGQSSLLPGRILPQRTAKNGGHIFLLFGWDDEVNGGSFLMRNTWGKWFPKPGASPTPRQAGPANAYLAYRFFLAKEPEAWLSTDVLRGPIPPG